MAYDNGTEVHRSGDLKPHPDSANENSAEPLQLSEAYVHSLASLGLERLQNEPGRLHTEAIAVDEALHSLSLDHYGVFIQNQECVRHVKTQGAEMGDYLSALLAEVQGLGAEFSVFQKEAAELVGGHKRNRQTLKHHMQLVELLEIPQLMDACVRSDLMEEALSIATFATTLERRHRNRRALSSSSSTSPVVGAATSPGGSSLAAQSVSNGSGVPTASSVEDRDVQQLPGVIKMIVDEVRESARSLHERLLAKLRGPIQLTTCLQVVSCLRRLELLALEDKNLKRHQETLRRYAEAGRQQPNGVAGNGAGNRRSSSLETGAVRSSERSPHQLELVEMKLQVDFLEARDAWLAESSSRSGGAGDLQHVLGLGSNSGPYQNLMDLIETSRSQWFEVATQFRAIFLSDSSGMTAASSAASDGIFGGGGGGRVAGGAGGDVLSLWLLRRVAGFVGQLKAMLPLVEDAASLRGLLEECMFFGASMGRLGADFRGLLVPVFEERVCSTATNQWASATADFVETLRDVVAIEAAGGNGSSLLHVPEKSMVSATAWPSDGVAGQDGSGREGAGLEEFGDGGHPAPLRSLMAFPPVARLVNLTLTSFNNLRECLPVSVEGRLTEELVRCFTNIFQNLADLRKTTLRVNAASEAATVPGSRIRGAMSTARALELSCKVLALQAIPHITLCFALLFGEGATAPGMTSRVSTDSMAASPAQGKGRAEKLSSRLLGVMEKFGIYEKPSSPPPGKPTQGEASSSQGAAAGLKKTSLLTTPSSGSDRAGTSPLPATVVGSSSVDILKTESGTSAESPLLDNGRGGYTSGIVEPRAVAAGETDGPS